LALLDIIAGPAETGLYEVRQLWAAGAAQFWHPVHERDKCADAILVRADRGDIYVGAALRSDRKGSADTIMEAHCLWADCDSVSAVEQLADFPTPTLTVRSGTGDNLHAWWALTTPLPAEHVKRANRRIAYHLGADMRATDLARIMRAPGTLNFKTDPPRPVELASYDPVFAAYEARDLIAGLADPPVERPAPRRMAASGVTSDDPLRSVSAETYYTVLTGREAIPGRHVSCPFWEHQSRRQMMLYGDGSWYCWPCEDGGSIYDFAARLWDTGTWGDDFVRLRERLRAELGVVE
jgi:hypothetical protein